MEQKFGKNSIDLQQLQDFCMQQGECIVYEKGERMEHEGKPAQWFGYVVEGCFKYTTNGVSDGKEHITWFSFEGEYVGDYPACLKGLPAQNTIEAMMPCRVFRVSGEQMMKMFRQTEETKELRSLICEHLLSQARERYLDLHRTTPRERYELLLHRCPGIVEHLSLNVIASFLNISAKTISMIRRDITFGQ